MAALRSDSTASDSAVRSASLSQRASEGSESSQIHSTPAIATENTPSMSTIHCQPWSPRPSMLSSPADSGPEMTEAMADPLRKIAMARPRSAAGNQRVK
jgi:hypothetical protein